MRVVLLLTLLIAVTSPGCDTSMVMTTSMLEKKANAFYEAAEYEEALRFANRLCQRKKDDYSAWELRALILMELGNFEAALDDAHQAWELMPDEIDSLRLRSLAYSANGMHPEAIADLKVVIERSARSARNQVELGYEYEQMGDYAEAIECYREAISINEGYAMAWNNWASVLCMAHDQDVLDGTQAKRFAARAVKLADTDEDRCCAWDTFGSALAENGNYKYALKAARKAMTFTEDERKLKEIKQRINCYKRMEPVRYPAPKTRDESTPAEALASQ